ncbi:MAG: serine/threonine protein kinase [Planctomycetota bacterium]|nr:MAG: serine/threonine protein kinase [Planctomycetota bacterium]
MARGGGKGFQDKRFFPSSKTNMANDSVYGQIAVKKKFLTKEQFQQCYQLHRKLKAMGIQAKPLGEILLEKGYLTPEQHKKILAYLKKQSQKIKIQGYEILKLLGSGGMGAVYKARQKSMDRVVALKVLSSHLVGDEEYIARFQQEAHIIAQLNHPNIVSGFDVGQSGPYHYFAMEYIRGKPLGKWLAEGQTLPEEQAVEIGIQMAQVLEHIETKQIVHCDIKPNNILLTKKGQVKLCDWGLARPTHSQTTEEAKAMGTPYYISPEQAATEEVDIRSDIYSLGATLYHLVVGEPVFDGPSPMVVMTKHLTEPIVPARERNPTVSEEFNAVLMKMLARHKQDRYQTPTELLNDFQKLKDGTFELPSPQRLFPTSTSKRGSKKTGPKKSFRRHFPSGLSTKQFHERVSFAFFVFLLVFLFASVYYIIWVDHDKYKALQGSSDPQKEKEAWQMLKKASHYRGMNPDDLLGIAARYREVIERYPNTEAAKEAEAKLKNLK